MSLGRAVKHHNDFPLVVFALWFSTYLPSWCSARFRNYLKISNSSSVLNITDIVGAVCFRLVDADAAGRRVDTPSARPGRDFGGGWGSSVFDVCMTPLIIELTRQKMRQPR